MSVPKYSTRLYQRSSSSSAVMREFTSKFLPGIEFEHFNSAASGFTETVELLNWVWSGGWTGFQTPRSQNTYTHLSSSGSRWHGFWVGWALDHTVHNFLGSSHCQARVGFLRLRHSPHWSIRIYFLFFEGLDTLSWVSSGSWFIPDLSGNEQKLSRDYFQKAHRSITIFSVLNFSIFRLYKTLIELISGLRALHCTGIGRWLY